MKKYIYFSFLFISLGVCSQSFIRSMDIEKKAINNKAYEKINLRKELIEKKKELINKIKAQQRNAKKR